MIQTYKYKLQLTGEQIHLVNSWIGTCRFVYNHMLNKKIDAYKEDKTSLSKFDLMKDLVPLKQELDWVKSVPSQSLQNSIERMDHAYKTFFKGGGFPKWAKKYKYNSILFKFVSLDGNWFKLPKLGVVKIHKDRLPKGELKTALIKRENNAYYLCVTSEEQSKYLPPSENQVGIDMGVKYFLVDSDGCYIPNPRFLKMFERKLRIEQRSLSRKKLRSNSWRKQKLVVSKLMSKIARCRADFLHKLSKQYIEENGVIYAEKLNIKGMTKKAKPKKDEDGNFIPNGQKAKCGLNKAILDVSWSSFFNMLEYKAEMYGREFIQVDPKHTSQECSVCGCKDRLNRLSQSKFKCIECGHEENADYNASKNIMSRGTTLACQREAVACA